MNTLEKLAYTTGQALARFRGGLHSLSTPHRAGFISALASAGKWQGGDHTNNTSQKRALSSSWFYTALNLISNEISAGRLKILRIDGGQPLELPLHPLPQLLRRPNPWMGRAYLWQYTLAWLYLDGNAYWFIQYDAHGHPLEIWPLPARDVQVFPGDASRFVDFYRYSANGQVFDIACEYILHFQFPNPFDVFRGLSPLSAAMLPVDSDLAMSFWNGAFFGRDNVMPSGIINLKPADGLSSADLEADIQAIKSDLRENYSASRRKSLITSFDSVQALPLGWNAREMDFIAGRQFSKEEIYQVLGVPSGLLDKNATEANAALADKIFKEKTVWPVMCLLAEQLTAQLVVPLWGRTFEAAFEDIRPANRQLELQEVACANGILTIDEKRRRYWQLPALADGSGASLGSPAAEPLPPAQPALKSAELKRWQDHAAPPR